MYKIDRIKNQFFVENTGTKPLYLHLYYTPSCDREEDYVIEEKSLEPIPLKGTYPLTLPTKEGLYKLLLFHKGGEERVFYIPQYPVFLASMVEDIAYLLCGCGCGDNCDGDDMDALSIMMKVISYNFINKDKYDKVFSATKHCVDCEILEANRCNLLMENVVGNVENMALLKKIVSYYYLVYYYTELLHTKDEKGTKQLFSFGKIYPCIKRYIQHPTCIYHSLLGLCLFCEGNTQPEKPEEPEVPVLPQDIIYYGTKDNTVIPTTEEEIIAQGNTTHLDFQTMDIGMLNYLAFPETLELVSVENGGFRGDFLYNSKNDYYEDKRKVTIKGVSYHVYTVLFPFPFKSPFIIKFRKK